MISRPGSFELLSKESTNFTMLFENSALLYLASSWREDALFFSLICVAEWRQNIQ